MYEEIAMEPDFDDPANDPRIEDIVHCHLCGSPWSLDGNGEGVVLNGNRPLCGRQLPEQIKLCIECGIQAAAAVERLIHEHDVCEHGVVCGDWCEPCNAAYKLAAEENA